MYRFLSFIHNNFVYILVTPLFWISVCVAFYSLELFFILCVFTLVYYLSLILFFYVLKVYYNNKCNSCSDRLEHYASIGLDEQTFIINVLDNYYYSNFDLCDILLSRVLSMVYGKDSNGNA